MEISLKHVFWSNFLGKSPNWFKLLLITFLVLNPVVFFVNSFASGWLLVTEFIFILAMTLKCYPLLPGGLLIIEAIIIGMTTAERVYDELIKNIEVLLLLIFMIAGVSFMKQLLLFIFTRLLLTVQNKNTLSMTFCFVSASLSAFLDALTVVAVIINVAISLYNINQQVNSTLREKNKNMEDDNIVSISYQDREAQKKFRSFLRSLMMHSSIGTALGGMMTIVGEPQNLIIARTVGWNFNEFFLRVAPISLPVFVSGLLTCWLVEKFNLFGYGEKIPIQVRNVLQEFDSKNRLQRDHQVKMQLILQSVVAIWLIVALGLHLAKAGLIGLSVVILITTFTGATEEYKIKEAFTEAFPFAVLIILFFAVVSVIIDQKLFIPIIEYAFQASPEKQLSFFYLFSGLLSSISDNVFVGAIYINEIKSAMEQGIISSQWFKALAIIINVGTNLPSIATPNGQASFLFLLTSPLSSLIRLSYSRMIWMAFPYAFVLTFVGFLCAKGTLIISTL